MPTQLQNLMVSVIFDVLKILSVVDTNTQIPRIIIKSWLETSFSQLNCMYETSPQCDNVGYVFMASSSEIETYTNAGTCTDPLVTCRTTCSIRRQVAVLLMDEGGCCQWDLRDIGHTHRRRVARPAVYRLRKMETFKTNQDEKSGRMYSK